MMEQGHGATLFVRGEVKGVPAGVQVRDAREITGNRPLVFFTRDNNKSPALYSDQFRYHMINKTGLIWADMDMFLLKPLQPDNGYLFAWQTGKSINGAILSLPENSPTLANLIEFCEDYYPIPPFERKRVTLNLKLRKMMGFPIHVSRQRWGVWGPRALTWFLHKNQEHLKALPRKSLYPIEYKDMAPFFLPSHETYHLYLRDALAVHLWGNRLRSKMQEPGSIPEGSFLSHILDIGS